MKFILAFVAIAAAADGDNGAKCLTDDKCTKDTDSCVQKTSEDADKKKELDTAGKTCEATADCGKDKVKDKVYWECAKKDDDAAATSAMGSLSAAVALAGALLIQ